MKQKQSAYNKWNESETTQNMFKYDFKNPSKPMNKMGSDEYNQVLKHLKEKQKEMISNLVYL